MLKKKVFTILYCGYLGGFTPEGTEAKPCRLLTIEEVGSIMNGLLVLSVRRSCTTF